MRPWPWILIALSSLIVFPELSDIKAAFPNLPADKLGHDVAYPAMLTLLPSGLLGLVAASLIAAFMSTMSTQLNLGASYLVNDFYHRFIKPDASEKHLVNVGRLFTIISLFLAGFRPFFYSAGQAFTLLLMIGRYGNDLYTRWFGGGSMPIQRSWPWLVYYVLLFILILLIKVCPGWEKIVIGAILTTVVWVLATYFTPPDDEETLQNFVKKVNPGGPGWSKYSHGVFLNRGLYQMGYLYDPGL
ncbi:MAG: hypothetical protein CM1200mP10_07130 [Candidatus Neomarinimicrobiota bacterium]|nr:MAG: hypothetical protein CM1200mP10_07130 [Candidatus Neomarinimicrobiota bacterium]